jgi:hypothetical protein
MRRGIALGLIACCTSAAACGVRLDGDRSPDPTPDGSQPTPDAPTGVDASPDGPAPLGPWGTPKLVPGASTTAIEDDATLSATATEMIFAVVDPAAANTKDLYYMSRPSATGTWTTPAKLPFNSTASDETPRLADNDLTLYFASGRAGGVGGLDIYKVTRPAVGGAWGTPTLVPGVNSAGTEKWFMTCPGTNTYLTVTGTDIGQGIMGNAPIPCTELNSTASETGTLVSADCKTIYFASNRSGTNKLYVATRSAINAAFNPPQPVVDFDGVGGNLEDPWLSPDLRTFVFVSDISGTKDVYISTR